MQIIFVSLIMGLVYLRLGHYQVDLQNRTGALFFGTVFLMFGGIMGPFFLCTHTVHCDCFVVTNHVPLVPTERKIFLYHSMDGLYSTAAYFLAKLLTEVRLSNVDACNYYPTNMFVLKGARLCSELYSVCFHLLLDGWV